MSLREKVGRYLRAVASLRAAPPTLRFPSPPAQRRYSRRISFLADIAISPASRHTAFGENQLKITQSSLRWRLAKASLVFSFAPVLLGSLWLTALIIRWLSSYLLGRAGLVEMLAVGLIALLLELPIVGGIGFLIFRMWERIWRRILSPADMNRLRASF
jgi:hypothetical protein